MSQYSCCDNPTMQYRSMGDKDLKTTYCPLALGADTNMFVSYKTGLIKEGYCGEVNKGARFYSNKQGYEFNPGTGPQVVIPTSGIKEGYCPCACNSSPCGCGGRGANAAYQGGSDVPPCMRKNRSGFINIVGV
jgi:hypothetical protein